jgi:hypothetical protein
VGADHVDDLDGLDGGLAFQKAADLIAAFWADKERSLRRSFVLGDEV